MRMFRVAGAALLLAGLLFAQTTQAQGADRFTDWRQARPFIVRADFSLAGYEPLLIELQGLQQDLVERLEISPSDEPIEIYLFQSEAAYRAYLKSHYPQAPARRALFVKSGGPGQVFAYLSPEFEIDLRHETTHAILHASHSGIPLWLDEGLAEYFEVAAGDRVHHNPHLRTLKWNLWMGRVPSISSLEAKRDLAEMGKREYLFAWAWVHFLLHGSASTKQELIDYLRQAQAGPPAVSLSQLLDRRLKHPEKQMAEHFLRPAASSKWNG